MILTHARDGAFIFRRKTLLEGVNLRLGFYGQLGARWKLASERRSDLQDNFTPVFIPGAIRADMKKIDAERRSCLRRGNEREGERRDAKVRFRVVDDYRPFVMLSGDLNA